MWSKAVQSSLTFFFSVFFARLPFRRLSSHLISFFFLASVVARPLMCLSCECGARSVAR
jgi:hypothetical protein